MNGRNPLLPLKYHIPDVEARVMPEGRVYLYGSLDEKKDGFCSDRYLVASGDHLQNLMVSERPSFTVANVPWASGGTSRHHSSLQGVTCFDELPAHIRNQLPADASALPIGEIIRFIETHAAEGLPQDMRFYAPDAVEKDGTYYLYFCMAQAEYEGSYTATFSVEETYAYNAYHPGYLQAAGAVQENELTLKADGTYLLVKALRSPEFYGASLDVQFQFMGKWEAGQDSILLKAPSYALTMQDLGPFSSVWEAVNGDSVDDPSILSYFSTDFFGIYSRNEDAEVILNQADGTFTFKPMDTGLTYMEDIPGIEETTEYEVTSGFIIREDPVYGTVSLFSTLYLPMTEEKVPLVILSHGAGSNGSTFAHDCSVYASRGIAAISFDFCGSGVEGSQSYGITPEQMTTLTELDDLLAVYEYCMEQLANRIDQNEVFLCGGSKGGLLTALAAVELQDKIQAAILYYPATMVPEELLKDGETALDYLARYNGPVLLCHGDQDPTIPYTSSVALAAAYENCKTLYVRGGKHGFTPEQKDQILWRVIPMIRGEQVDEPAAAAEAEALPSGEAKAVAPEGWDIGYFSQNEKLSVLFESKEIADFKEFMIHRNAGYTARIAEMTLVELGADSAWDPDGMEYGINHLLDVIHSGVTVAYDYYTPAQMKENPDLKNTKLFYLPGEPGQPFVVLCAGGGFTAVCTMVESFPVAAKLNEMGYNVFCVSYRTAPPALEIDRAAPVTTALEDLGAAMKYIYMNARNFKISAKTGYAIGGFSAGAMLVGNWGVSEVGYGLYGIPKPQALFLLYGSGGSGYTYTEDYPPSFFCYCLDDTTSPPVNNQHVAAMLQEIPVPIEVMEGEHGGHGFGLGLGTDVEGWVEKAVDFWQAHR